MAKKLKKSDIQWKIMKILLNINIQEKIVKERNVVSASGIILETIFWE